MKKSFAIILCAALVAGFSSCNREIDDVFDESPAHRLNHAIKEYTQLLSDAENGWVMEYMAQPDQPAYPLLVKFTAGGSVTVAAKNPVSSGDEYKEKSSLYEIIADNGPVLTFNTYNELLHAFSNPEDDPSTDDNEAGRGHEGDYEFIVYRAAKDHFVLKGKKYGFTINMTKVPADLAWEDYFTKLEEIRSSYFSSKIKTIFLNTDKGNYTISGMGSGLFNFVPEGGDPISQTITHPYTVRLDGTVYLNVPFTGEKGDLNLQNFSVAEDGTLYCTDKGQTATMTCGTPAFIFTNKDYKWRLDKNVLEGDWKTAYDNLSTSLRKYNKNANLKYIELSYNAANEKYNLLVKTNRYSLNFFITENVSEQTIKFAYQDGDCEQNASVFYKNVAELRNFIALLTSKTFNMSGNSPMAMTVVTLGADNGNLVFNLQ